MGHHLLVCTRGSSFQGFLGGVGLRPSTVVWWWLPSETIVTFPVLGEKLMLDLLKKDAQKENLTTNDNSISYIKSNLKTAKITVQSPSYSGDALDVFRDANPSGSHETLSPY